MLILLNPKLLLKVEDLFMEISTYHNIDDYMEELNELIHIKTYNPIKKLESRYTDVYRVVGIDYNKLSVSELQDILEFFKWRSN